jgi:hypothetical protein
MKKFISLIITVVAMVPLLLFAGFFGSDDL